MGTRNLTMVIFQEKTRVAQYGQWDGYPSGQGTTILTFIVNVLITGRKLATFKSQLLKCRFNGPEQEADQKKFLKKIGVKDGWLNEDQSTKFDHQYPYLSRDHGGKILELILKSKEKEIWLADQSEFAADSLFCEWAYVIDFDKDTFEVYKGFNTLPVPPGQRFSDMKPVEMEHRKENKYYPVTLVKSYRFNDLPSHLQFIRACEETEEEVA